MIKKILTFALVASLFVACGKEDNPVGPNWGEPGGNDNPTEVQLEPEEADNIIIAHRGRDNDVSADGPDNSLQALRYAMSLGCYGSECDIYWTKDNQVVVAHADGNCQINGMYPWEHTLAELRKGGALSNGEQLPTLEDFIKVVMTEKSSAKGGKLCTRLILDIKNITSPSTLTKYPIKACERACEIIKQMKAEKFCHFICTGNSTVMASSYNAAVGAGIEIAWMSDSPATTYLSKGYRWANLSLEYMNDGFNGGRRTIDEFEKNFIELSVFNVDLVSGSTTAEKERVMDYYLSQSHRLRALCTNYPSRLLKKYRDMNK